MCFGDDEPTVQNVTSRQIQQIPAYMEKGGEELFKEAGPIARRDYPLYEGGRIAPFAPDTTTSFDMVRDASGSWRPAYEAAMGATGQGIAPIGAAEIAQYMNPYTESVINPTVERIMREAGIQTNVRHGEMAKRGSYLNEDRRAAIDALHSEGTNRVLAETIANLMYGGYNQALTAAQNQQQQRLRGATMYGQLAPLIQQLGYQGAAGYAGIGEQQQGMEQAGLNLRYSDFINQFRYPQEQLNWLISILGGTPYSRSITTNAEEIVPETNTLAQMLGGGGTLAGGLGMLFGAKKP